ncbi:hypothetical protein [Microbacter margulisiae]|uniref:Uncharacterized protein n=1 Tax=Microbacter margulisiae TaxID=1350067 RepID=A0A7W5DR13_9PORP|nr:hypothetical protein [Microbacter margulisiae]MBB3187514.1 hypothetical protein [Microbacter margulisiae]
MNQTSLINMLPVPFRFNPWKHHLHWVEDILQGLLYNSSGMPDMQDAVDHIRAINNNYVDVYTGSLTFTQLLDEVNAIIKHAGIESSADFLSWLDGKEFRVVTLSDKSAWVLREGAEEEFYLHLHPARSAPHIIRLHGNSWKTAIVARLFYPHQEEIELGMINELRKNKLNLSPIKNMEHSQRLREALRLLGGMKVGFNGQ